MVIKHFIKVISLVAVFFDIYPAYIKRGAWDWETVSTNNLTFPENFIWGAATAAYQNYGADVCKNSNWAYWEQQAGNIKDNQRSGNATGSWDSYATDVNLIRNIGLNSLRMSIDWSLIEPTEGIWDEAVLRRYSDIINSLLAHGITPMITLHHFVHPQWFEEKGAFEQEDNIRYLVRFCEKIFDTFSDRVKMWCTINEPNIYVFQGYISGCFPPGYKDSNVAGRVLKNILKAHCDIYRALKKRPGGKEAQIGFAHQHLLFEPMHENSVINSKLAWYLSQLITTASFEFFKTGSFKFCSIPLLDCVLFGTVPLPLWGSEEYCDADAPNAFDFIGLNYYSHVLLDIYVGAEPVYHHDDIRTDMPYAAYPEGFYNAIVDMSTLGKPIYITENGIADARDDRREIFIKRYLYAMHQAIKDGYDIRGYYYWTLMDNFEWDRGFEMKFGLYHVDFTTKKRTLRNGSKILTQVIAGPFQKIPSA